MLGQQQEVHADFFGEQRNLGLFAHHRGVRQTRMRVLEDKL